MLRVFTRKQLSFHTQQEASVHMNPLEAKLPGRTHCVVTAFTS